MFFLFKYCFINKNGWSFGSEKPVHLDIFAAGLDQMAESPPLPHTATHTHTHTHTPSAEMLAHTHLHTADSLMHHNWSYQWSYRCTTYWPTACNSKKTQSSPDMNQRSLTLCHCPSLEVQRSVEPINMTIFKQNYISNRAVYEFNYSLLSLSVKEFWDYHLSLNCIVLGERAKIWN